MGLKYEMPKVGDELTELDLKTYADSEGYEIARVGNTEHGGMLLTLSDTNAPIGMSFLLIGDDSFKRVY